MFEEWKKRRAIRSFVTQLPKDLAARYGRGIYTVAQVTATLEQGNYSEKYRGYAFAMCLSTEDAAELLGDTEIVEALSTEIANRFFDGDTTLTVKVSQGKTGGISGQDSIGVGYESTGEGGSDGD